MTDARYVAHSHRPPAGQSGELLDLPREQAGWQWMSFQVRQIATGETWNARHDEEETALVLLGGKCLANWGEGEQPIGGRVNVFDGLPYALYLPAGTAVSLKAQSDCEVAVCSVPSKARLAPRLITPKDVTVSLRGGGNASRQIVDLMRSDFPADKLMLVEVYTPGGNWSSFPPHKHDVHNPPGEVDLDEIYYYRMRQPAAYAHQRLYTKDGTRDLTLTLHDGDVVMVRDGYHPVVAAHGYDIYYLNCLAGSARSLASTEDDDHTWVRSAWKHVDPRLPIVGSTP